MEASERDSAIPGLGDARTIVMLEALDVKCILWFVFRFFPLARRVYLAEVATKAESVTMSRYEIRTTRYG